jgi:uncharacterized protein YbgA (DUF1722 family)
MGTRGKHVNVLQHLMGYLKKDLSSEDNAYLRQVGAPGPHRGLPAGPGPADRAADVASHRLKHHLNRYPVPDWVPVPSVAWVHQQVYLNPYPKELMLRNHVWDSPPLHISPEFYTPKKL